MDVALLLAFCASFFLIAISPGLCMTLAMTLGISVGVRRSLWMMLGELTGIALVGGAALIGVGTLLSQMPVAFRIAKILGASYLLWTAVRTWRSPADVSVDGIAKRTSAGGLVSQGFITAIANPKAWAFFAALLPPFLNHEKPLLQQIVVLLGAMLTIEFICLLIYAQGGRSLSGYLRYRGLGQWLNRVAACMMILVAVWLVLS